MTVRSRPTGFGLVGVAIALAGLALAVAACGNTPTPTQLPASAPPASITPTPAPTPAPTPSPTPAPTPAPAPTPSPTPSATLAPSPSPTPSPSAAAVTIDDYAWVYEKRPMTLRGTAGTTTWTKVLFGAKTVELRWSAAPATSEGCSFRYKVESKALSKPVSGSSKTKNAKTTTGSRNMTINYGDGKVTVTTTCEKFTLKAVSTGHPGVVIKPANDPYKATGATATELNNELAEAGTDWGIFTSYTYLIGGSPRVTKVTVRVDLDYELPKWTPPDGTDPALVDAWNVALKNMRRHIEGEAAIAVQAGGRYAASLTKKSFSSKAAMEKYYDTKSDKAIDNASNRHEQYNEDTQYGYTQGAYIE